MNREELRTDWFVLDNAAEIDPTQPGIYQWRVHEIGVYIGKAKSLRSRAREYARNLRLMINGLPYRIPGRDFRAVHYALMRGYHESLTVTLTFLENCPADERKAREDHWIAVRRQEACAGGLPVLNADRANFWKRP